MGYEVHRADAAEGALQAKDCGPSQVQFVEEKPPGAYPFGYHASADSQNGAPFWNEVR